MIGLDFGFGPLEAEFWRLLFVMTRIGAALFAAPLFGAAAVPAQVRVIVTGALAVFVCCWTPVAAPPAILSLAAGAIFGSLAGTLYANLAATIGATITQSSPSSSASLAWARIASRLPVRLGI